MSEAEELASAVILLAKKGQRLPDGEVRHCGNCVHNVITHQMIDRHVCMLSGYELSTARTYAIRWPDKMPCDVQMSGWTRIPRPAAKVPWWRRLFKRAAAPSQGQQGEA